MAVAEVIIICIDNSMEISDKFKAQLDAIRYYCKAKLDANPENEVGLFTMGSMDFGLLLYPPTSDFQKILDCFPRINPGTGRLSFLDAVDYARLGFTLCPAHKQKRMLFFIGGLADMDSREAVMYGKELKDLAIAVDVVNFYRGKKPKLTSILNQFGRMELDAFVNAANCNHNSHIKHVKSVSSICEVLSQSVLKKTPRLSIKKNHHKKATGKNQAATDNKHVPNLNRFEASSLENQGLKLGKRKMVAG